MLGWILFAALCVLGASAAGLIAMLILDTEGTGRFLIIAAGYEQVIPRPWQSGALTGIVLSQIAVWALVVTCARMIFTALTEADVHRAGRAATLTARWLWLWLMLVWGILAFALATAVASWHFPPGERSIAINVGTPQISTAFAALLATFISRAFVLGAELWQDHQEVI
ncbi:hypothetical protein [Pseudaestuariivita rosea]|uniref:hypothetical protein n=1 Tax=Pseudaestuariivita rosea TaxID=2763263 RepID=UPI001ABB85BF|nr:hypothetical protein [Pseudaestuariivita rosea]